MAAIIETVCAGYTRAFQYILQQLGIPCYYCTGYAGGSHAWNIVACIVALRRINPVPIFVISEDSAVAKRILALQNGADDFLQKPYDMDECMAKVYALLRRYIDLNYATENNCKMKASPHFPVFVFRAC